MQTAIENENTTLVSEIIECNITDVMVCSSVGKCPLHLASQSEHTEVLHLLLDHPLVDINQRDIDGQTALYVASKLGYNDNVEVLLDRELTKINMGRESDGKTPLIVATEEGHTNIVHLLTSNEDIQVNKAQNTTGTTALGMAATNGHIKIVRLLIDHPGIDINKGDDLGQNPLILAAINGHEDIMELLIADYRIDVNLATSNKKTALMEAAFNGNVEGVKLLLAHPNIGVNLATFNGKTALLYATLQQEAEIVTLLLRCPRTATNMVDEGYKTPPQYAIEYGFTTIIEAFESRGELVMQNGHTCCSEAVDRGLITATEMDDISSVNNFMRCLHLDINKANEEGFTSLYIAARSNQVEMVRTLSASLNIDINKYVIKDKQSPLMISSEAGHQDIVRVLLAHIQIDVNQVDSHGTLAIQKAMMIGELKHVRVVKLFLRCPMTEVPNYAGGLEGITEALDMRSLFLQMSPSCCKDVDNDLLSAAWQGDHLGIRGILRCPTANIHVMDNKGRTPLFLASMQGHNQAVQVLLSDPNIDLDINLAKTGEMAFSIASRMSHFDVMAQLIRSKWTLDGWCNDNWTPLHIMCRKPNVKNATESPISTITTFTGNKLISNYSIIFAHISKVAPCLHKIITVST